MKDSSVIRWWQILFFGGVLIVELAVVSAAFIQYSSENTVLLQDAKMLSALVISVIFFINWSFLLYYCAYVKHGTTFLFLCAIMSCLTLVFDLYKNVASATLPSVAEWGIYLFMVFWAYLCYRMRKINQQYQKEKVYQDAEYKAFFEQMQALSDLDALQVKYREGVEEYPQIEKYLKLELRKREAELSTS